MRLPLIHLLARARFWWCLFVLWAVGITVLSSLSALPVPPLHSKFLEIDKLVHAAAYCVGALFLTLAVWLQSGWSRFMSGWVSLYGMFVYGVLDEMHQTFVPHRTGLDAGDLAADVIGAGIGVALILLLYGGIQPRPSDPAQR